jgi:putative toxin-antitoxin system antitoxin component (TIGR02293 family)
MEYVKKLAKFMGGPAVVGSPKSEHEFIEIIRRGLPSKVIRVIVKSSSLSEDTITSSLRFAKRTAARRKATGTRLKSVESELVYRFCSVFVAATEILGNEENARQWLMTENGALNGCRPIDLLDTGIGFEELMDVLRRIDCGVYS